MKLTEIQIDSVLRSARLAKIVQDRLANKVRMMFHNAPQLPANKTPDQIEAYNLAVDIYAIDSKIESFAKRYYPLIADWQSLEKRIFVLALADFDYTNIEGVIGDELIDIIAAETYLSYNIVDLIIDQSFKAITFPPVKFIQPV
jgi:hypothetical protein